MISANTIRHNYDAATSDAKIDITQAREVDPDGTINENRGLNPRVYAEGMGGVVTEMTFHAGVLRTAGRGDRRGATKKTARISRRWRSARRACRSTSTDSDYDWEALDLRSDRR